ncbi:MAG: DUF5655 domain-containing protein, partial [Chloroflexota bacterium]|nr:DUF5655 domain-containing protein [Chloroflexota bacterium]
QILDLGVTVREEPKKWYIAYKIETNFVDIEPQQKQLRLTLNVAFDDIDDPLGLCKDLTGKGKQGNGDVGIALTSPQQIQPIMALIEQSFHKHVDEADTE